MLTRLYLVPSIGQVPLAKIQPEHVTRLLAVLLQQQSLSVTTVRHVYATLRSALAYAHRQGKVVRNVATLVDPPAKRQREMHPLTREQARVLHEGVRGNPLEALYVTALGTGMRQGELLALRWQDVDLERGELSVRHTLQRFTRQLAPTKTTRSQRTLRLPDRVVASLAAHRGRQTVLPLAGYVFTTRAGAPLDQVNPPPTSTHTGRPPCRSGSRSEWTTCSTANGGTERGTWAFPALGRRHHFVLGSA